MLTAEVLSWSGATVCGLVGAKLLVSAAGTAQRFTANRQLFRLRNEALREQLRRAQVTPTQDPSPGWEGWRKFRVQSKVREAAGCHSIYLVPLDGKPLPAFRPGQFLTFSVRVPGEAKSIVRCYSLSDAPSPNHYRCTIKQVPPAGPGLPPGRVSTYFNHVLKEGDILDAKAPRGGFVLDLTREDPIVLLAGGVGITPLLSMANAMVASGSRREVYFVCGFRNSEEHLFRSHLQRLAQANSNIHVYSVYSRPASNDVEGSSFDAKGYVTTDFLRKILPSNNFEFYLCGPGPFMNSLDKALRDWGVPPESIKSEAFGPASVPKSQPETPQISQPPSVAQVVTVRFARSNIALTWDPTCESLLDFAERNKVPIDAGCRSGNCGTCTTAIRRGAVHYTRVPDAEVPDGSCFTCIATPEADLELDA